MFKDVVEGYAFRRGMPGFRFTFVPHPITGVPAALCRKYLQGNDPITGKPILDEIIDAITRPLSAEDAKGGTIERPTPRLVAADTEENLQKLFQESGWTDGLPVILPTEARVKKMLEGTSHEPTEHVGRMQASFPHEAWTYNVEQVAVNAVMAGAKPEHLPVILALASIGTTSLSTSTTSFATMVVVNGPIRNELKMNTGIGALGPFNHPCAVIGRAWTLMSLNLGASGKPGEIYMGSLGNNLNYNNLCMAENEEELPKGWDSLHVQKGFKPNESVVSTFLGWGITHPDQSFGRPFHEQIPFWLKFVSPFSSTTLLLDPTIIKQLNDNEGFKSKEQLSEWIQKNSMLTAKAWREDFYAVQNFTHPYAAQGREPTATYMKLPDDALIPQFGNAGRISILSIGGGTNYFWQAADFGY
jgi:hypothetical protein